ncbi:universal stress protein [Halobacillus shinanisalinarum]|uniref:Universal stress protein n=1 Tax=Halobacillus shinanisalinarum TaxID=2932258 RepID=A0ABY4GTT4_9BACI|nr:universal stress protein [Halobacillus shinanisalinarum]UOQ91572.1 universal stress protein [Halobacillus shinanisalinarum]
MFDRILLASDGSDHAVRATHMAVKLTGSEKHGKVTVIYTIDGSTSKTDVLSEENSMALQEKRRERLHATEDILQSEKIDYEVRIVKGDPGPTIVKFANENRFSVVVVGSRGLNRLQEMVLGSVSHKVAKRAECPVVIVK